MHLSFSTLLLIQGKKNLFFMYILAQGLLLIFMWTICNKMLMRLGSGCGNFCAEIFKSLEMP